MRRDDLKRALDFYRKLKPKRIIARSSNLEVLILEYFSNRNFIEETTRNEAISENTEAQDIELRKKLNKTQ